MKTVAIIPCYNADPFCEGVIQDILPYVDDIVLVNDGSTDKTHEILERFSTHATHVYYISFGENQGKGFALLAGMRYALERLSFDVLITLDGDGQHTHTMIEPIRKKLEKGADFVIGMRKFSKMPLKSRVANTCISFLLKFCSKHAPYDTQSGLRGFSKKFVQRICEEIEGGRYEMEFRCILLALKHQIKIVECVVPTIYINKNRHSHFRVVRDTFRVLMVFLSYWKQGGCILKKLQKWGIFIA